MRQAEIFYVLFKCRPGQPFYSLVAILSAIAFEQMVEHHRERGMLVLLCVLTVEVECGVTPCRKFWPRIIDPLVGLVQAAT